MPSKTITFRVSAELLARIRRLANKADRKPRGLPQAGSQSDVVRRAIEAGLPVLEEEAE